MPDENKNLKEIVEGVNKSFADLKTELDNTKSKVDSLDELKLDRITDDITKKLQEVQEKQAKTQAMIERGDFSANDIDSEKKMLEEHKAKFETFMRTEELGQIEIMPKAMSTDVNPDGGYLVRPELANFVADRVFETSPLRQVARVQTIGTKSMEVLIDDNEAAARWVGEGASGGQTNTPQVGIKEIVAHKIEAVPRITIEQMQDSYLNVEAWLQDNVGSKIGRTENTAFVSGDGVKKPRGFLSYAASSDSNVYERNTIGQVNLGNASNVTSDGLIDLQNALKEPYQANAVFGMKRQSYGEVLKLKGNDQYFFGQNLLKDGQLQLTLLGKPVIFMDDMPAIAANTLSFVYGDFSVGYTIVDRVGLQVLKDPYKNHGFMTYYTTKRTGGDVTNFDAIKIGKIAS